MVFNRKDIETHLVTVFQNSDPSNYLVKFGDFITYLHDNYNDFDSEAKAMTDNIFEKLDKKVDEIAKEMPEGLQKRAIQRIMARKEGKHYDALYLIKKLERQTEFTDPIFSEFRKSFIELMQYLLDQLYEIAQNTMKGSAENICLLLFYSSVEELLVSFHLCQHAFTTQAYSHIRTTYEIYDKVELFSAQPKWIDLWISKDEKRKIHELSPKNIRIKLGKEKYDPIYSFLSEIGTHVGFSSIQARTAKGTNMSEKGNPIMHIWVGGSPMQHHIVSTCTFCLFSILQALTEIPFVFKHYLNLDEYEKVLEGAASKLAEFTQNNFNKWAESEGMDVSEIKQLIMNYIIEKKSA